MKEGKQLCSELRPRSPPPAQPRPQKGMRHGVAQRSGRRKRTRPGPPSLPPPTNWPQTPEAGMQFFLVHGYHLDHSLMLQSLKAVILNFCGLYPNGALELMQMVFAGVANLKN